MSDVEGIERAKVPEAGGDEGLTPVHPNYRTVLRITIALTALPFLVGASVLELVRPFDDAVPGGIFVGPVLLLAGFFLWRWPRRRYQARGYDLGRDRRGHWRIARCRARLPSRPDRDRNECRRDRGSARRRRRRMVADLNPKSRFGRSKPWRLPRFAAFG
mgnify:CR=1 FL=1